VYGIPNADVKELLNGHVKPKIIDWVIGVQTARQSLKPFQVTSR